VSRPIPFSSKIDFQLFLYQVADEFEEAAGSIDLVWKSNRMSKNISWAHLKDADDFKAMLELGESTLKAEAEKRDIAIAKNTVAAEKARKKGQTHIPKPVPASSDYLVILRDRHQEQKNKAHKKVRRPIIQTSYF
jgi:hypothetical protein